jgi:hypothetical protein
MFVKMWDFLNGKKLIIASLFWVAKDTIVPIWANDQTPQYVGKILTTIGILLTSVGLGHKLSKRMGEE